MKMYFKKDQGSLLLKAMNKEGCSEVHLTETAESEYRVLTASMSLSSQGWRQKSAGYWLHNSPYEAWWKEVTPL